MIRQEEYNKSVGLITILSRMTEADPEAKYACLKALPTIDNVVERFR
ncbi:MAG TPA: hypothetical protein PKC30_16365 [Saprospiraceae bacterium]|nr:hypothetical protein [Saprospiraceae bacterium]